LKKTSGFPAEKVY